MTDTEVITVLKLLGKGRPLEFITAATSLPISRVQAIADKYGWPDQQKITAAIAGLDQAATRIPVRAAPEPARGARSTNHGPSTAIPPSLVTPAVRRDLAPPPGPTVDELVRACRRSESKRTQALGPKLAELAERVTAALRTERDTAEAKRQRAEEFAAKKAAVDKLAAQLAKAKAELRELKPTGVTEAALDFACEQCGDVFSTSSGRARHITRKHSAPTRKAATA